MFGEYILLPMLHCMEIFFPWLNCIDLFPIFYQAGNSKKIEKYSSCSNVSIRQLTGMKGKLWIDNEVKLWVSLEGKKMSDCPCSWTSPGIEIPTTIQLPFQLPNLPTAVDYCISPPPWPPKMLISKFKHVIFHLFTHTAIKIFPNRAPLVLYPLL